MPGDPSGAPRPAYPALLSLKQQRKGRQETKDNGCCLYKDRLTRQRLYPTSHEARSLGFLNSRTVLLHRHAPCAVSYTMSVAVWVHARGVGVQRVGPAGSYLWDSCCNHYTPKHVSLSLSLYIYIYTYVYIDGSQWRFECLFKGESYPRPQSQNLTQNQYRKALQALLPVTVCVAARRMGTRVRAGPCNA